MNAQSPPARYAFGALYATAFLILFDQFAELAASLYPFKPDTVQWRFAAYGLAVGRTTTLLLADALVVLAALGLRQGRVVRVWGILHLVFLVPLLAGLVGFGLDALEVRRDLRADAKSPVELASVRAVVVALLAVGYCVWAGVAALRATRAGASPGEGAGEPLLVTGRGKAAGKR